MREMMKMSVVCVMAILVCFGCTKKAKVNLDGLDQNPAGTVQEGEGGTAGGGNGFGGAFNGADPFVVPVANTNGGGNGAGGVFDPNNPNIGGSGAWSGMDAALSSRICRQTASLSELTSSMPPCRLTFIMKPSPFTIATGFAIGLTSFIFTPLNSLILLVGT